MGAHFVNRQGSSGCHAWMNTNEPWTVGGQGGFGRAHYFLPAAAYHSTTQIACHSGCRYRLVHTMRHKFFCTYLWHSEFAWLQTVRPFFYRYSGFREKIAPLELIIHRRWELFLLHCSSISGKSTSRPSQYKSGRLQEFEILKAFLGLKCEINSIIKENFHIL